MRWLIALLSLLAAGIWAFRNSEATSTEEAGKGCFVVHVHDGDTFTCTDAQGKHTIRLYGVDTPEIGVPFAIEARDLTRGLVLRRRVTLIVKDTDRYGREVMEVHTPEGADLAAKLLAAGLARWYKRFAASRHDYERLEREARAAKAGLWKRFAEFPRPNRSWRERKTGVGFP